MLKEAEKMGAEKGAGEGVDAGLGPELGASRIRHKWSVSRINTLFIHVFQTNQDQCLVLMSF